MSLKRNKYIIATFFSVILILFIILGLWQLERYKTNKNLSKKFEEAYSEEILETDCARNLPDLIFQKVKIAGTLLNQHEQFLFQNTSSGQQKINGYFILTPLTCGSGGSILVNRGWVEQTNKNYLSRGENIMMPEVIEGILMPAPHKKLFSVEHNLKQDILFWTDINFINNKIGFELPDYYLLQTNNFDDKFTYYPLYKNFMKNLPHLQYAIFWFIMALIWSLFATYLSFKRGKK